MSSSPLDRSRSIFGRRTFTFAKYVLIGFTILGLLAPILCNDRPILAKKANGDWVLPWTRVQASEDWTNSTIYLQAPIRFNNTSIDKSSINWKPPFYRSKSKEASRHWLGSSKLGKDVLAGMIYGSKSAMIIGFLSVGLAFLIGVSMGMMAGYAKDDLWKANLLQILVAIVALFLMAYYFFYGLFSLDFYSFLFTGLIGGLALLSWKPLRKLPLKQYPIPVDTLVIKLIEIRKSIPLIYLLLAATALIQDQSIWLLSMIIGCVVWVPFARHSRASTLSLVEEGYIQSARALGLSDFQIILKHIFKGILPQVTVVAAFAMSGAIVLEATLSFLGMGMPVEYLTWGSMLAEAKQNPSAWWMAVFPGLGIFLTVLACNIIGEHLSHE